MKKKNMLFGSLAGALLLAPVLSGCGKPPLDDSGSGGNGSDGQTVNIEFWHTFGQGIQAVVQNQLTEFERLVKEHEGVDVHVNLAYQGNYTDIKSKIEKGFPVGHVPAIAVAYPDHVADYLHQEQHDGQYVVDLAKLISDEKLGFGTDAYLGDVPDHGTDDIVEAFYKEGQGFMKPGTFTLPYMKSSEVLFYNKEKVDYALHLKDPDFMGSPDKYLRNITWDEFIELGRFIMENKSQIVSTLDRPIYYDSDANLFITKMYQNGIPYSSIVDGKGHVDFESGPARTKAEEMVARLKESHGSKILTTKGVEGEYGSNKFTEQKALFTIGSSGGAGYNIPSSAEFTVGMAPVPCDAENPLYVTQGPCLTMLRNPHDSPAKSERITTYAWKLMKYLLTPVKNVEVCISGSQGYIPVRLSCYTTEDYQGFLREGEDFAQNANVLLNDIDGAYLNTPIFPGSAALRDACGALLTQVFQATETGDALKSKIHDLFQEAIYAAKLKFS